MNTAPATWKMSHKLKSLYRSLPLLFFCVLLFSPALAFSQLRELEILVPNGAVNNPDYSSKVTSMIADPSVAGATITVYWSDFDCGTAGCGSNHAPYEWSITDAAFNRWEQSDATQNGKKINIVVQMISNSAQNTCPSGATSIGHRGVSGIGNCAMPAWIWTMLGSSNYSSCGGTNDSQRMPNYFDSNFQLAYQNAIAALITHYAGLGLTQFTGNYIRPALGHGGEMLPIPQWNVSQNQNTLGCLETLETWSHTQSSVDLANYWFGHWLTPMATFMGGANFPMQIMGAITPMGDNSNCIGCLVPDLIAPVYVNNHMGFGSQGFEISDVGSMKGTADWVGLFNQSYRSGVPLELQTLGQSCPGRVAACDGGTAVCKVGGILHTHQSLASCTGDLPTLLPFAASSHATIFEIYFQDWDLGNALPPPDYCTTPGDVTSYCYSSWGSATHSALENWVY